MKPASLICFALYPGNGLRTIFEKSSKSTISLPLILDHVVSLFFVLSAPSRSVYRFCYPDCSRIRSRYFSIRNDSIIPWLTCRCNDTFSVPFSLYLYSI